MPDGVVRVRSGWCDRHIYGLALLRVIWTLISLPVLALLVILEPVARVVLGGFALLMTLSALFWGALRGLTVVPFWSLLEMGVAALLLLALYYALMRLLSL